MKRVQSEKLTGRWLALGAGLNKNTTGVKLKYELASGRAIDRIFPVEAAEASWAAGAGRLSARSRRPLGGLARVARRIEAAEISRVGSRGRRVPAPREGRRFCL